MRSEHSLKPALVNIVASLTSEEAEATPHIKAHTPHTSSGNSSFRTIVKPLWRLLPSEAKNPPVEHQHFPDRRKVAQRIAQNIPYFEGSFWRFKGYFPAVLAPKNIFFRCLSGGVVWGVLGHRGFTINRSKRRVFLDDHTMWPPARPFPKQNLSRSTSR